MSVVHHMGGRAGRCFAASDLDRRRPASRLVVWEALCGIVFGGATLPFTTPGTPVVPEWVQLLGLATLLATAALKLRCWRDMLAAGLRPLVAPVGVRLSEQVRDERRVRLGALVFAAVFAVLLPIPATWVTFWFTLNLMTIGLATIALAVVAVRGGYSYPVDYRVIPAVMSRTTSA